MPGNGSPNTAQKAVDQAIARGDLKNYKAGAMELYGDIYAAQNKKDETIAKYKEALKVEGITQGAVDKLNKKISGNSGK